MKMPQTQGTESKARLSRRQMMMIAYSRFSGFGRLSIILKSNEFAVKRKLALKLCSDFVCKVNSHWDPISGRSTLSL